MSDLDAALAAIRARIGPRQPRIGMVIGSGLGALADDVKDAARVSFADIPGFPRSAVAGHAGQLVVGTLGGRTVAALSGRVHSYEGHSAAALRMPIRALRGLGCGAAILISACGSISARIKTGRLAAVSDQIVICGFNPLTGPNDDAIGPRFTPMNDAYDPALRKRAKAVAKRLKIPMGRGVMAHHPGPSFETPAEIRAYRRLGGELVGMSMAPETLVARHCGLRVLGLGAVTNMGAGMVKRAPSHAETLKGAAALLKDLRRLIPALLEGWDEA